MECIGYAYEDIYGLLDQGRVSPKGFILFRGVIFTFNNPVAGIDFNLDSRDLQPLGHKFDHWFSGVASKPAKMSVNSGAQ